MKFCRLFGEAVESVSAKESGKLRGKLGGGSCVVACGIQSVNVKSMACSCSFACVS